MTMKPSKQAAAGMLEVSAVIQVATEHITDYLYASVYFTDITGGDKYQN